MMPRIVIAVLSLLDIMNWFGMKSTAVLYSMKTTTVGQIRERTVPFQWKIPVKRPKSQSRKQTHEPTPNFLLCTRCLCRRHTLITFTSRNRMMLCCRFIAMLKEGDGDDNDVVVSC